MIIEQISEAIQEDRLTAIRSRHHRIDPAAINRFCEDFDLPELEHPFERDYQISENYEKKFILAEALIEDGRYLVRDPGFLVRHFVPKGKEVTAEARELRDVLHFKLIEKGVIPEYKSQEEDQAQDAFLRAIQHDEELRNLGGVLPLPVFEIATRVRLWGNITDEEKLRKIRSFAMGALLRDELGAITVQMPIGEIDLRDIVLQFPEQVFKDTNYITSNIVRHYFTKQTLRLFINGEEEGFRRLHELVETEPSEAKKEFFSQLEQEFQQVKFTPIPNVFVDSIDIGDLAPSPMPLFMHKFLIDRFLRSRRKLWNGGTRATKTATFYQAVETIGAKKTVVFGPAKARNTWPREAGKLYKEGKKPDVFAVRSKYDLDNSRIETAQVVFIGAEFLGRAWGDQELHQKIKEAISRRKVDMVGLDESHEFRNQKAGCSLMLMELMDDIRDNYRQDQLLEFPVIALTATPISTGLENVDITMAILYPERFVLPGKYEAGKTTFSVQALRDPMIAFSLLYGEQLMDQWDVYDLFGERIPHPEYERVKVEMSPSQRVIYEWVRALPVNALAKIRLLRSVLLNPELIKKNIEEKGLAPEVAPVGILKQQLQDLHHQWLDWIFEKDNRIPDELFSADWIAKYGGGELLLQSFFSTELSSGINTLAESIPDVANDWVKPIAVSPKYEFLMKFLQERVALDPNGQVTEGFTPTERVFITVPYHRRGITRWIDDPNLKPEELDDNAWSLYEYMLTEWLPGLPSNMAITIDASRSFAARDRIAQLWRETEGEYAFVVSTMDTINESMDWAPRDTEENQNITTVNAISTHYPFTAEEFDQWAGRFIHPAMGKATRHLIVETEESFDTNSYDLVRLRSLIMQMTLAAVPFREQDREFYRASTTAKRIILTEPNVGQAFLRDVLRRLKGRGSQEAMAELSKNKNGRSGLELFAEFYMDDGRDEFRIQGNNNEMEKNIVLPFQPRKILSVGAGSCLFARKLRQAGYAGEIDNVDMNGVILRMAQERYPEIGTIRADFAESLSAPSDYYDLIEHGFVGPWTKRIDHKEKQPLNEVERVKYELEANRVLKLGGIRIETFPESAFDEETFKNRIQALTEHFGFRVIEPSGMSYATDLTPTRRIGWVITAQKVGVPNLSGLDLRALTFLSDERTKVSEPKEKRNGDPTVIRIDYPIFSSREFTVVNPLTQETSPVNPIEDRPFESSRDLVNKIKDNLTLSQREKWNALRRDIERGIGRNYENSEEILAGIIHRRGGERLQDWDSFDIIRRVNSDVIRFIRRNRNGSN